MTRHAHATMGEHRSTVLRRFAPINQEGDKDEHDGIVYGQIHEIVLLRSLTIHLEHETMGDTRSNTLRKLMCVCDGV